MIITNINITLKDSIVPSSQTPPSKSTEISDKAPSIETPPDTPVSNQLWFCSLKAYYLHSTNPFLAQNSLIMLTLGFQNEINLCSF